MPARPAGHHPHADDTREGHREGPADPSEQRASTAVSALFMVLMGLPIPAIWAGGPDGMPRGRVAPPRAGHYTARQQGKMFPLFGCRRESGWRERPALAIDMCPRGVVGAGILVIALPYGLGGANVPVVSLSLPLHPLAMGLLALIVRRLIT